ncbi:MAG: PQQ-binding-like beta-propeller repeat protein, partial [bacterium]
CLQGNNVIFSCVSRDDQSPPFVAVDITTGKTVWEASAGPGKMAYSGADCSSVAFRHNGKNLFFGQGWRRIGLFDGDNGKLIWESAQNSEKTMKPGYGNGFLWFQTADGNMQTVKLADDAQSYIPLWSRSASGYMQYTVLNGRMYMPGNVNEPKDLRPLGADGKPVIELPQPKMPVTAPTGGGLICVDIATGKVLSSIPLSSTFGSIISADGMVYVLERISDTALHMRLVKPLADGGMKVVSDYIFKIDPKDNEGMKGNDEFAWSSYACPVISDGRLFLKYGSFYVFDLRAELPVDGVHRDGMGQVINAKPPIKWSRNSNLLWTATLPGAGKASPVTSAGKVFVSADGGVLSCTEASTGKELWKQAVKGAEKATALTPIMRDDRVFVDYTDGSVACYDLAGTQLWQTAVTAADEGLTAPVLSEKLLLVQGEKLTALKVSDGKVSWETTVPKGAALISPAKYRVDATNILVTSWGSILRATDGGKLYEITPEMSNVTAVVADAILYLRGNRDGKAVTLALKLPALAEEGMKLEQRWANTADVTVNAGDAMVVADGALYILTTGKNLCAVDLATGKELYSKMLEAANADEKQPVIGLVSAGGKLYATIGDETWIVKPDTKYNELWRYNVKNGAAEAAFAGDQQYLRGGDKLYCVGGSTPVTPAMPDITDVAPVTIPDGVATSPLVDNSCPQSWLVAGPFKAVDLNVDYLADLGGRAAAVPKVGNQAKNGADTSTFRAMPEGAWWTDGGRFTNDMKSILVVNGENPNKSAFTNSVNSTVILSTVIAVDAPRYVRFRLLTPDGISWNYKQRLNALSWMAGKQLDGTTVYKLEKGKYPLLIQAVTGKEIETWGKIWMCPRLVDCTPEIERKMAEYQKQQADWDNYQNSLKT